MKIAGALLLAVLHDIAAPRTRDGGAWLQGVCQTGGVDDCAAAFADASRYMGRSALSLSAPEIAALRGVGVAWSLARWARDDLGRAIVLLHAADVMDTPRLASLVERCYRGGDVRERQAVVRALPLLPHPDRFLVVAVDACRSREPALFEAIACENPYPALHVPPMNFNHMVLDALVSGVALDRIVGLGARVTPQLVRMANDYAGERRASGRSIPADLDYITEAARTAA